MSATVKDIAEASGVCIVTVRKYADKGLIPVRIDGRGWRYFPEPEKVVEIIRRIKEVRAMKENWSPMKKLRLKAGVSQNEFSILLNCSAATLSAMEAGSIKLTENVLEELREFDIDTELFVKQHEEYREKLRVALVEKVKKALQGKKDET